ncbi:MAG: glycosyltransferase family 2 protein [Candidatus Aenigmarchaeota archaeon]|nr:glycosyltransferase family 2 protein [Candidatus Aenigmarchaeota archaeon]
MIIAVMPAYNEEKTIGRIIRETRKYVDKIIVVDDGSKDATAQIAKKADALVVKHEVNKGLGMSIRTGLAEARRYNPDIIITIDADGQHDPKDIPKFVDKVKQGYDFVLGSRDLRAYPFIKKVGNFFLNFLTNLVCGTALMDTESGFRAFSRRALKKIKLQGERYEIAADIIFQVGKHELRACNVPIKSPRYIRGKGVTVGDGFRNFLYLIRRRKRSLKDYWYDLRYVVRHMARKYRNKTD